MKRRNVLSSLAVVGTGVVLGGGLTNDLFAATPTLSSDESKALSSFQKELEVALSDHTSSGDKLASRMVSPTKVIHRKETKKGAELKIKTQANSYLTIIRKNGQTTVRVSAD